MKKTILILSLLIFSILSAVAVRKVEANPLNVAAKLTEYTDSASIASTCDYYGYELSPENRSASAGLSLGEIYTYTHPNGSSISISYLKADNGKFYPTIEVTSKVSSKEKDRILRNLNFRKIGDTYERRSVSHITHCTSGSNGSLIFRQQPKADK